MSISVELPKDSRQFAVDTVGAAMCYKLLIKATEELSKVSPAYVAPISKPSAATAVCAIFGIKTPLPQPIENLIFKATFGTSLAVLAAEISLRVIGSAEATQREAAAVMAVALTYLLQKLVKFKGKIDALQVHTLINSFISRIDLMAALAGFGVCLCGSVLSDTAIARQDWTNHDADHPLLHWSRIPRRAVFPMPPKVEKVLIHFSFEMLHLIKARSTTINHTFQMNTAVRQIVYTAVSNS